MIFIRVLRARKQFSVKIISALTWVGGASPRGTAGSHSEDLPVAERYLRLIYAR